MSARSSLPSCCVEANKTLVAKLQQTVISAKQKIGFLKEENAYFSDQHQKQSAINRKIIVDLRDENTQMRAVVDSLQDQVRRLRQLNAEQTSVTDKGAYSLVFCRSLNTHHLPSSLEDLAESFRQQWYAINPEQPPSGKHAYGEPTLHTMARICHCISSELQQLGKPLKIDDILLDWGSGAGKWLCFGRELLGPRHGFTRH
jgi:hypothetical protein